MRRIACSHAHLLCGRRIECITRPIDDDQPAVQYDQLQIHVDRRKPTHLSRSRTAALGESPLGQIFRRSITRPHLAAI